MGVMLLMAINVFRVVRVVLLLALLGLVRFFMCIISLKVSRTVMNCTSVS